jgi:hypothetical protein
VPGTTLAADRPRIDLTGTGFPSDAGSLGEAITKQPERIEVPGARANVGYGQPGGNSILWWCDLAGGLSRTPDGLLPLCAQVEIPAE